MAKKYIEVQPSVGRPAEQVYKCRECGYSAPASRVARNLMRCTRCGTYFRMRPRDRVKLVCDKNSFEEYGMDVVGGDPLEFPGYAEKLASARERSGETEAVLTGLAAIKGQACAVAVMDPTFMMGSMGYAVGERIARLIDHATDLKMPS